MPTPWTGLRTVALFLSVAVVVGGCAGDTTAPSAGVATQTFGGLRLDQHAITLAVAPPHNTVQLHVTQLSQAGTPLPDSGTVQYQVAYGDTSVSVSPAGLVTAKFPSYTSALPGQSSFAGPNAFVIASLTAHGITRADTAVVVVTATEPDAPLATFSIQPPAESLSVYMSGRWLRATTGFTVGSSIAVLNLIQLDSHGDAIPNQLVYYNSSNINVAYPYSSSGYYGRGVTGLVANDTVTFFAQTWYYGVARADSLQVRVGYQSSATLNAFERTPLNSVTPELYWWPQNVELTAPARVLFHNPSNIHAVDVVFDDPTDVQIDAQTIFQASLIWGYTFPLSDSGNVAPFFADVTGLNAACAAAPESRAADSTCTWKTFYSAKRYRRFLKPGTYTYHTMFGSGGKIVVH